MNKNLVHLALAVFLLIGAEANAETVFYQKKTRVDKVDCDAGVVTLPRSTMALRTSFPPRPEAPKYVCEGLKQRVASQTPVTLLTVAKKTLGDFIVDHEVVGFVDSDMAFTAVDYDFEQVFPKLCGHQNRSFFVCIWMSTNNQYFLVTESFFRGTQFYSATPTLDETGRVRSLVSVSKYGSSEKTTILNIEYGDNGEMMGSMTEGTDSLGAQFPLNPLR